jgi:succinate dehydrogenase / fumarate reductase cytochrome b subunit
MSETITPESARPLSPHIQIYRWQIQMVTSILHRATGVALAVGSIMVCALLLALAAGPYPYEAVRGFCGSGLGLFLLLGWTWSLCYHLLNGIRHLLHDAGMGFGIAQFIRAGWISVIGSFVLTALIWACVFARGGVA